VAAGKENSLKQIKVFASFFKKKCLFFVVFLKAEPQKPYSLCRRAVDRGWRDGAEWLNDPVIRFGFKKYQVTSNV
jgi:hypothetical protein